MVERNHWDALGRERSGEYKAAHKTVRQQLWMSGRRVLRFSRVMSSTNSAVMEPSGAPGSAECLMSCPRCPLKPWMKG